MARFGSRPYPTGHKFHARPSHDGVRYWASRAEKDYYGELLLREKAGEVSAIDCQPVVELVAGIRYRPDFVFNETYRGESGLRCMRTVYVDVKGVETREFRLKCKLWKQFGPGPLRIVKRGGKREPWRVVKEIIP